MRLGATIMAVVLLLVTTGCERRDERVLFEGEYFRTKASPVDRQARESFVIEVPGVSRNFEAAREAGRFGGTRYCIESYGTSDIRWTSGPDDPPETLLIDRDRLTLRGTCLF